MVDPRQVTVHQHLGIDEPAPVEYDIPPRPAFTRQTTVYTYTNTPEPPSIKPAPNPRHSSKDANHRTPPDIVERARRVLGGFDLDPFSSAAANEVIKAERIFVGGAGRGMSHTHGMGYAIDGFAATWGPWHCGAIDPADPLPLRGEEPARVFCNPPGGRGPKNQSNQKRAWFKLAEEWNEARVSSALFVCFSVELLQTTQVKTPKMVEEHGGDYVQASLPLPLDFPICFPSRRVRYLTPDGKKSKSPPHASCLVLLPDRARRVEMVSAFVREFSPLGRVVVPATWGEIKEGEVGK